MGWIRKHSDVLTTIFGCLGAAGNCAIELSKTGNLTAGTALVSIAGAIVAYLVNKHPQE